MKERPILFSAPMVRALLDGTKTQTRRTVKRCGLWETTGGQGMRPMPEACPYGRPGDRLWVRETWGYRGSSWSTTKPEVQEVSIHYRADDGRRHFTRAKDDDSGLPKQRECRPDEDYIDDYYNGYLDRYWKAWRPSIHMPRWASRITLEVTNVRVQRLRDLSEADAQAEGVEPDFGNANTTAGYDYRRTFSRVWDSINGDGGWIANPWVWVVEFRRLSQP